MWIYYDLTYSKLTASKGFIAYYVGKILKYTNNEDILQTDSYESQLHRFSVSINFGHLVT